MKKMIGIDEGGKKIPKAGVKKKQEIKLPEATEKLNDLLKKKSSQGLVEELAEENNKPIVDDFLPLLKGLNLKTVNIKNNYVAIKDKQGKVLTYVRNTGYGFSIESKNESGNWIVSKITKKSEFEGWVKEIQNRLK